MEIFYFLVFGGLAAVVAVLELSKSSKDRVNTPTAFNAFKNNYLLVYSLMMAGDWLQGPYVYYLYSQYGYGKGEIGQLFIAGFGSSMLQIRAREAEEKAVRIVKEKEMICNGFLREYMQLLAYRNWVRFLEIQVSKMQKQEKKDC